MGGRAASMAPGNANLPIGDPLGAHRRGATHRTPGIQKNNAPGFNTGHSGEWRSQEEAVKGCASAGSLPAPVQAGQMSPDIWGAGPVRIVVCQSCWELRTSCRSNCEQVKGAPLPYQGGFPSRPSPEAPPKPPGRVLQILYHSFQYLFAIL